MVGSPPSAGGSTIENRTTPNAVLTTAVPQDVHSGSAGTPSFLPSYLSRNMENLDLDGPEIPTTRPIARSQYSLVLDDDPLPEFWEAVRMPDGNIFFVDHKTQTTTWDDPRSRAQRDTEAVDINSAWAVRLMSPLPDTPEGFRTQFSSLPTEPLADAYLHKDPPFPELLRDGYVFNPSFPNLPEGPLPDFWEEQRGSDGHVYYIDHAGATIIKKASLLG
ncbi:hypothetical protein PHLCEN_2v541 [Hermanssonia centrifuga]|uniref:WW domain-containing protein n=1 Tax=Hermanssonia centrifuga TaxID=98765 RepID=A0A2R6S5Q7_9APHY|nr:hypothetical protein PHLCEN_2v541 [Hermanssonia centrifuga]